MHPYLRYLMLIFLAFEFSACSRVFFGPDLQGTPTECLDYLEYEVDRRYSLFETKGLNWDSIMTAYRPMVHDSMSGEELLDVLGGLVGELEDGHVNIYTDWNFSRNWDWYLDYPSNFDSELIERHYLGKKHWRTGPFWHTIIDSIAYVYYGSFAQPVSGKALNALIDRVKDCKGLVFDIRNNGGGKLSNVKSIASRFADTTRTPLHFFFKSGPAHDSFDGPFDYIVKPAKTTFTNPIVILTNRKSYSAATFFPALMSAYPHVTIMGDTSGGGGGIPYHIELPNGWNFRLSTTITKDAKGRDIELGIPPDINVALDHDKAKDGIDTVIEAAFAHIKSQAVSKPIQDE